MTTKKILTISLDEELLKRLNLGVIQAAYDAGVKISLSKYIIDLILKGLGE